MVLMRYGIISEVDYTKGVARVYFDEIDIVSGWLTLPKNINENKIFEINTQVAVLMHSNGEDGEILHEVPSDEQLPPTWADENTEGFQFKDGSKVTYNSNTGKLTIDAPGKELIFNCTKLTVNGTIEATGDVKAATVSLINHVHVATPALAAGSVPVTGTITIAKP